jgi:hypothetical protein
MNSYRDFYRPWGGVLTHLDNPFNCVTIGKKGGNYMSSINVDLVWKRICDNEGKEFRQIRGKTFTYSVSQNTAHLNSTNRSFTKNTIESALEFVPLTNTLPVQHLQAPSYLYAILMDNRIRESLW